MSGHLAFDIAHLLAGCLVLASFMLLYQDRLYALINVYAGHALVLTLSVAWQAYIQNAPHLYITAGLAFGFKAIVIPVALRRIVQQLGIHREIETVVGIGLTMLAGMALVALSMVVMLRVTGTATPIAREDLAFALAVVLLGLLIMVTRRNAVSQIIGFMSLENGLVLAATGAKGMPLVVEISVAFSILIAFIVIGIFLFRIRERFDTVDVGRDGPVPGGTPMMGFAFEPMEAVLLIPLGAAALLACLPGYRLPARLNVAATFLTLLASLSLLLGDRPAPGRYLLVDDLNIVFIVLNYLRRIHHQRLQRQLYRPRDRDRPADAGLSALLSRHVSGPDVRHEPGAAGEQHRADVGRDRDGDAHHRADGRNLPHPRGARGGLEIFHSRQRRHRAGAVRHHPDLCRGAAGDRRRRRRHGVDGAGRARSQPSIRRC